MRTRYPFLDGEFVEKTLGEKDGEGWRKNVMGQVACKARVGLKEDLQLG